MFLVGLLFAVPAGADEPAQTFSIPFETTRTQHMVVEVKINGKGPYRVIFDTGAPFSLLTSKVAREAKLTVVQTKKAGLPGTPGQYRIQTLETGDLKTADLTAVVMDHPTVSALATVAGPIEGILGFSFFAHYRTTIDYEKGRITLEPVKYEPGDALQTILKKFAAPRAEREAAPVLAPAGLLGLRVEKSAKDEEPGVVIAAVTPGSAAAEAGLRSGDRLLTLDRRWTDTVNDCYAAASRLRPGTPALAVVRRDGKEIAVKVDVRAGL